MIKLLCEQFPQTFSRDSPRPLKVGVHADVLGRLPGAVESRDLKSALRAYTSNRRYLRVLVAGASRVGLDGETAGIVTAEDELFAKDRLAQEVGPAEPANTTPANAAQTPAAPAAKAPAAAPAPPTAPLAGAETDKAPARSGSTPKRLSLADLREAGRRRREAGTPL